MGGYDERYASKEWVRRQEIRLRAEEIIRESGAPRRKIRGTITGADYASPGFIELLFGGGGPTRVMRDIEIDNPDFDKWERENKDKVSEAYRKAEEEFDTRNPIANIRGR